MGSLRELSVDFGAHLIPTSYDCGIEFLVKELLCDIEVSR